jgi:hypothetical protein
MLSVYPTTEVSERSLSRFPLIHHSLTGRATPSSQCVLRQAHPSPQLSASSSPETSLFARKRTPFTLSERVLSQYDVPAASVTSALRLPRSHVCVR